METTTNAATAATPKPVSAKIAELNAKKAEAWAAMQKLQFGTKEAEDAMLNVYKLQVAIDNEQKAEMRAELELEQIRKRNEKVAFGNGLLDAVIDADRANVAIQADKKASIEAKNDVYDVLKTAREKALNEIIGKFSVDRKPVSLTTPATGGTKGAKGAAILDMFIANRATGMTDTENKKAIVDAGHAVGTVGAVILAWQRETGEKV